MAYPKQFLTYSNIVYSYPSENENKSTIKTLTNEMQINSVYLCKDMYIYNYFFKLALKNLYTYAFSYLCFKNFISFL